MNQRDSGGFRRRAVECAHLISSLCTRLLSPSFPSSPLSHPRSRSSSRFRSVNAVLHVNETENDGIASCAEMRKPDVIGLYTMVPWDDGSISDSTKRRFRPFYIPPPSSLPPWHGARLLTNVAKRESDLDVGKSRAFSPRFSSHSRLTPDSLITARFSSPAKATRQRLSL